MAEDDELNIAITGQYAEFQAALEGSAKTAQASCAVIKESAASMATAVDASFQKAEEEAYRFNALIDKAAINYQARAATIATSTVTVEEALARLSAAEQARMAKVAEEAVADQAAVAAMMQKAAAAQAAAVAQEEMAAASDKAAAGGLKMEKMMEKMIAKMVLIVLVKDAITGVAEAYKKAGEEAEGLRNATELTENLYGANEKARPAIKGFVDAMEEQDIAADKTLSTLSQLIPVCGSLDNAINASKLAIDLVTERHLSYSDAIKLVRDLIEGKPEALKEVHDKLGISATNTGDAIQEMYRKIGGGTEAMKAAASDGYTLADAWKKVREASSDFFQGLQDHQIRLENNIANVKDNISAAISQVNATERGTYANKLALQVLEIHRKRLAELNEELAKYRKEQGLASESGRQQGQKAYAAPTPNKVGTPKDPGAQATINAEAEAAKRLADAYKELDERKLATAEASLKDARGESAIEAAAQSAVDARMSLLGKEQAAIEAEQAKELKGAHLTAQAKKDIDERTAIDHAAAEEKAQKDVDAIRRAASIKILNESLATLHLESEAAKKGSAERVHYAEEEARLIGKVYGQESQEYAKAQQDIVRAQHEADDKILHDTLALIKAEEAAELGGVKVAESILNQEATLHQKSNKQIEKEQEALENRKYAIELKALQRQKQLYESRGELAEVQKIDKQIEKLTQTHWGKLTDIQTKAIHKMEQAYKNFAHSIVSSFGSAIDGLITRTQTWQQATQSILGAVVNAFASAGEQVLQDWIDKQIAALLASKASNIGVVEANTASAAMGAAAAVAPTPFVGPGLAVAAAAGMEALGQGFVGMVAAAEGGFDVPSYESPVTKLHPREMVLDQEDADTIRSLRKSQRGRGKGSAIGGGGNAYHFTIQAMDGASVKRAVPSLLKQIHGAARRNHPLARKFG